MPANPMTVRAVEDSIAYPLNEFYQQNGQPLPSIEEVEPNGVPSPFDRLLIHQNDMTPTLENFHGAPIHITAFRSELRGDAYYREVVLQLNTNNRPVEFGAIKINLDFFPKKAHKAILGERLPLGTILARFQITHKSRPKAFLRIQADDFINHALRQTSQGWLYGRRNTLFTPDDLPLAEIVEVLPKID